MENTMYRKLNRALGVVMLGLMLLFPLSAGWLGAVAYAGAWGFILVFLAPVVCLVSAGFLLLSDDDAHIALVVSGLWVVVAMIVVIAITVGSGA